MAGAICAAVLNERGDQHSFLNNIHLFSNRIDLQHFPNLAHHHAIYEGAEFSLKQYGGDDFVTFMKAFFNNYSGIHKPIC